MSMFSGNLLPVLLIINMIHRVNELFANFSRMRSCSSLHGIGTIKVVIARGRVGGVMKARDIYILWRCEMFTCTVLCLSFHFLLLSQSAVILLNCSTVSSTLILQTCGISASLPLLMCENICIIGFAKICDMSVCIFGFVYIIIIELKKNFCVCVQRTGLFCVHFIGIFVYIVNTYENMWILNAFLSLRFLLHVLSSVTNSCIHCWSVLSLSLPPSLHP